MMLLKIESLNTKPDIKKVGLFVIFLIILITLSGFFLENKAKEKLTLYIIEFINVMFFAILLILFHFKKLSLFKSYKLAIYAFFINVYISHWIGYQTDFWKFHFEAVFIEIQIITMVLIMAIGILFNFKHLISINIVNILFIAYCIVWNVGDPRVEKYYFYFMLISGISVVGHYLYIEIRYERRLESEKKSLNSIIKAKSLYHQANYNKMVIQNLRLKRSYEILRRNNVVRDKLISIIIHEVKSPLHYFVIKLGTLQKNGIPMDQMIMNLREIEKASSLTYNTLQRISDWVQFYKADNKRMGKVWIKDAVDVVLRDYKPQIEEKKIHISNVITQDLVANMNETMFILIINNLVGNAIKYTENGQIDLSGKLTAKYIVINIKDTGTGMSDNQLTQFRETSMIATAKGSREEEGLGIGLYLISEIINDIGGEFTLEHNYPTGVAATVYLPVS